MGSHPLYMGHLYHSFLYVYQRVAFDWVTAHPLETAARVSSQPEIHYGQPLLHLEEKTILDLPPFHKPISSDITTWARIFRGSSLVGSSTSFFRKSMASFRDADPIGSHDCRLLAHIPKSTGNKKRIWNGRWSPFLKGEILDFWWTSSKSHGFLW